MQVDDIPNEPILQENLAPWTTEFIREALFGLNVEKWLDDRNLLSEDQIRLTITTLGSLFTSQIVNVKITAIQGFEYIHKKKNSFREEIIRATNLFTNYGYRILKAEWAKSSGKDFMVELRVTGVDSGPGVIQTLANEISNNLSINIRSLAIEGEEGVYEGRVKIIVKDKNQLNHVIRSLKELENISTVERISN